MAQPAAKVQVSIGANLDPKYQQTFKAAGQGLDEFGKKARDLGKTVGNVEEFARQKRAVENAKKEWQSATARVGELKRAIDESGKATRAQQTELNKAIRASRQASNAYTEQNSKLGKLRDTLRAAGVNTSALTGEYRRLRGEMSNVTAQAQRMSDVQRKADLDSIQRQHRMEDVLRRRRIEQEKENAVLEKKRARLDAVNGAFEKAKGFAIGATAAGAVLARPVGKALTYEEQLAYMADTAGAGGSAASKAALQKQLSDSVDRARLASGGATREDVAAALNAMLASGKFDATEVQSLLPSVARASFAGQTQSTDVAQIAIALKEFGIRDVGAQFDRILRAGQLGNFEMKDMAKALPEQLSLARAAGYSGVQGLTDLLAFNQVATSTAGNSSMAGNNVKNLLIKFNSAEFSKSIADNIQVQKGDPFNTGKKGGKTFDWTSYAIQQRERGVSAVEAFGALLDRQMAGNKQYQDLQKRAASTGNDAERNEIYTAMSNLAEGSQLGKIIADQQALMAAIAARTGARRMADLREGLNNSKGAVDASADFLGGQNFARAKIMQGNLDRANEQAFSQASGPIGSLIGTVNDAAQSFPGLTTAAYAATTALGALAAAGAGIGAYKVLTGGAGKAAAAGGAAAAGKAVAGRAALGVLGTAGLAAGAGALVANAVLPDTNATEGQKSFASGNYFKASYQMPAGDFVKAVWGKITSDDSASKAASEAAKAASEAATTAQNRPNMTITNTYSVPITVPQGFDAAQAQMFVTKALQDHQRKQDSDRRSMMTDRLGY